jgi:hypothetical protein
MFGIFKKKEWRPVVIHHVEVGEVLIGTDEDELMKTIEQISNKLFKRLEVRYNDTSELFRLVGELRDEVELCEKRRVTKPKVIKQAEQKPAEKVVKVKTLKPVAKKKAK